MARAIRRIIRSIQALVLQVLAGVRHTTYSIEENRMIQVTFVVKKELEATANSPRENGEDDGAIQSGTKVSDWLIVWE